MGIIAWLQATRSRSQAHKREVRAAKLQSGRSWQDIDDELREYVARYDSDVIAQLDNIYVFADRIILLARPATVLDQPGAVVSTSLPDSAPIRGARAELINDSAPLFLNIQAAGVAWLISIRPSHQEDAENFVRYLNETALAAG